MTEPGILQFAGVSFLLFVIGLAGVTARRNLVVVVLSIELMLNAANLNFIAFSRYWQMKGTLTPHAGEVFAVFVLAVAAIEVIIGLAILLLVRSRRATLAIDEFNLLKW